MNLASIILKIRSIGTAHPVAAAVTGVALLGIILARVTGYDVKATAGVGNAMAHTGAWIETKSNAVAEKRLGKAVAKAEKKAGKKAEAEAKRVAKSAEKLAKAQAAASAAAEKAAQYKAA